MGARMTVMQTKGTKATVALKELRLVGSTWREIYRKELKSSESGDTVFAAAKFHNHEVHSGIASVITVLIDGVEQEPRHLLDSETFLRYAKLIFDIDVDGSLTIRGVRAKLSDICRLWGFGFLGRKYKGRKEELIKSQVS